MDYDNFVQEFKTFSINETERLRPAGTGEPGGINRAMSFFQDFSSKHSQLNDSLVQKANSILDKAELDADKKKKLKDELFELGKKAMGGFVSKYKPR